jgi:hypothetical protein
VQLDGKSITQYIDLVHPLARHNYH